MEQDGENHGRCFSAGGKEERLRLKSRRFKRSLVWRGMSWYVPDARDAWCATSFMIIPMIPGRVTSTDGGASTVVRFMMPSFCIIERGRLNNPIAANDAGGRGDNQAGRVPG